ncbi:Glucose/sorbosone dehydrogenase-like protein [Limnochorda pilosa]|uniref:Glucose/sorbosone dehydrogenase-like protein n=2 Tax=Limnochorda pilosa TaxID=1555112 RepID=A0A0K2SKV6_LIMPI|nr:Glucose/sorbosone dehydrogenase-like protein [Limnochorda pilosa]
MLEVALPGEGSAVALPRGASGYMQGEAEVAVGVEVPPNMEDLFPRGRTLLAPRGTRVNLYAAGLSGTRMMAWDRDGALFVSSPSTGWVLRVRDRDGDGAADEVLTFADGLNRPHGLAVHRGTLLVAETGRIVRLADPDGDGRAERVETVSDDLPAGGMHWTRTLGVGPDGALYASAGSSCNACQEEDPRRAAILRFAPQGEAFSPTAERYAWGLRNAVGFTWHPASGDLWATENGRDLLGDDLPPDELNRIVKGADYGWPYCFGDRQPDPSLGDAARCEATEPAAMPFQAHSAPLGLAFGAGLRAEERFTTSLFVAFHGSWNRTTPTGYKVVRVPFDGPRPRGGYEDLLAGWLQSSQAWGRPVGVSVGPDGALYVSDDRAGVIYRVRLPGWSPPEAPTSSGTEPSEAQ